MDSYPHIATERFDKANIWIAYILSQLKKYLKGNILEVGAGCGSFSRGYIEKKSTKVTLTDSDDRNIHDLKKFFTRLFSLNSSLHIILFSVSWNFLKETELFDVNTVLLYPQLRPVRYWRV